MPPPPPPLFILASASPRRRELLSRVLADYAVVVSDIPEPPDPALAPRDLCLRNARAKAGAVARLHPHALVLGADTEVALDGCVFGKPADLREAAEFLRRLAGRTHEVITGLCLRRADPDFERLSTEVTLVTFQPLTDARIADYLQRIQPLDKAGAYAVQEHGDRLIEAIQGSLTNVIGLPLGLLRRELEALPDSLRPIPLSPRNDQGG